MTKKAKAQQIFNDLWYKGVKDRQKIIRRFIDVLDMTPAGAATYYANCKKATVPEVATSAFTSRPAKPTTSILDTNPTWMDNIVDRHKQVIELAERLYDIDLSDVGIRFDLKGRAAGMACRRGNQYYVRYNSEACRKYFDEQANNTIPHEIAHIVCMKMPHLGKHHNAGWKRVCRSLGGDDSRCHNMRLTSGKTRYRYLYNVDGEDLHIGPKVHRKIQHGSLSYFARRSKKRITHSHFIKKVQV